jgi:hypothetical protein
MILLILERVPGRVSRSDVRMGGDRRNRAWQFGNQRGVCGLLRLILTNTGALLNICPG